MRKISLLCVVLVAFAFLLCMGIKDAKADALLFPYFKSGGGAYTFISLQADCITGTGPGAAIVYYYDDLTTATMDCIHENHPIVMTSMDLAQIEVTNQFDLSALWTDASSVPSLLVAPSEGFLIVDDDCSLEGAFFGEAAIIDTTNGFVTTYKALNNPVSTDPERWDDLSVSKRSFLMSNYPDPEVSTTWFVLATGTGMFTAIPSWGGRVTLDNSLNMVYDRNEDYVSGDKSKPVVCFDYVERTDLMTAGQLVKSGRGGLWLEAVTPDPLTTATGALMVKIQSTNALGVLIQAAHLENAFPNRPY